MFHFAKRPAAAPRPRARRVMFWAIAWVLLGGLVAAADDPAAQVGPVPQAPPDPPVVAVRPGAQPVSRIRPMSLTLYSIGEPTDEEQQYLEDINRARANPPQEGVLLAASTDPDVQASYAYFQVDLGLMTSQFNQIAPAPPLAFNAQLIAAARLHSLDMSTNGFQGHYSSDGSSMTARLDAQDYAWSMAAENVYAWAKNPSHGHAGFEVDWGMGPGGMQDPPGHRNAIHNPALREVGIGVVPGYHPNVGPQVVTQDFGSRNGLSPFVTGVVYYDLNANGAYDAGEGIGGVTVTVAGSTYYAVSATSGGYAVPVPGNGTYSVSFTMTNLVLVAKTVVIADQANAKVDCVPAYAPPTISGPDPAALNLVNTYTCTPVAAAAPYQWRQATVVPASTVEGAEQGLSQVTATVSAGYYPVAGDVVYAGKWAFHLVHPTNIASQVLTLNRTFLPGASSQLSFASRLALATSNQVAKVQVSANGGASWQDLWTQAGVNGTAGEATFTRRSFSLAAFAGQEIQLRLVYAFVGVGSYYPATGRGYGWYVDEIAWTATEELVNAATVETPARSFDFVPSVAGIYLLRARPVVSGRMLDFGPAKRLAATLAPLTVRVKSMGVERGATPRAKLDFEVINGPPRDLKLEWRPDLGSPWSDDNGATIETLSPGQYRALASGEANAQGFFRVRATP
jgi:hypothetical protein